jgi:hypothetical protein
MLRRIRRFFTWLLAPDDSCYVIDSIEYVRPGPPPPPWPLSPEDTARLLERTRQSILNRPPGSPCD